jgi:hypothetical protein
LASDDAINAIRAATIKRMSKVPTPYRLRSLRQKERWSLSPRGCGNTLVFRLLPHCNVIPRALFGCPPPHVVIGITDGVRGSVSRNPAPLLSKIFHRLRSTWQFTRELPTRVQNRTTLSGAGT